MREKCPALKSEGPILVMCQVLLLNLDRDSGAVQNINAEEEEEDFIIC